MSSKIIMCTVVKNIPLKEIPSGTGDPTKETQNMLEDKNDKQVRTSTVGKFKDKYILRDENYKQVFTSIGGPLKNKGMPKEKINKNGYVLTLT